ncbi:MAG: beta-lactamase family protein [Pseudomonadota bacterium]|nr:beta-lactamase family protein [Pseudomonadota bacterium]
MSFTKYLAIVAVAAVSPLVPATASEAALVQPSEARANDFKSAADAMLISAFPADGPGGAAIVTRGGKVIYSAGRGLADVEGNRSITPDTPFRLGSIVKQFTAGVVLQLVAEGKMSLDDPVSRFFPDYPQPGAGATVRQLLNHSSGIQDFSKIPGWIAQNRHRPWTTAELLATFRDLPPKAKPGHAWEYNNGGYVLLGAIIEKATGKAWHEQIADRIARPLGLKSLDYAIPSELPATSARGYAREDGRQQAVQLSHMSLAHAAGGLNASVADMARWAQALHHGKVVTPALYQEMIKPARLADGSTEPYGFGLRLREIRGRPALVHGGSGSGLDTDSAYIPSGDLFVAVFANSSDPASDPSALVRRLAALALGQPIPTFRQAALDMAAIEPLFGSYDADQGPPRRFFARDGKLYLGRADEEREARPAGGDRFFFGADDLDWFRIVPNADGKHVMEMDGPELAAPLRAVRTGPVPPAFTVALDVLQSYVGTFKTETVTLTVSMAGPGKLTIGPAGQPPQPMRPVSETEFRVDGGGFRVVFHKDNGAVGRMTVHRGARELHGKRVAPAAPAP